MMDDGERKELEDTLAKAKLGVAARRAIAMLFPSAQHALETLGDPGPSDLSTRRKKRRLAIADFANNYFALDPRRAIWSKSELGDIFTNSDPWAALQTVEDRIAASFEEERSHLRRLFLDELRTTFDTDRLITKEWLCAILDASPLFLGAIDHTSGFLTAENNSDRLRRMVISALEPIEMGERAGILEFSISRVSDLSVLCDVFRSIAGDVRAEGAVRERVSGASFGERTGELREKLLDRVREMAQSGSIWQQAAPIDLVLFWWGSTSDDEISVFLNESLKKDEALRVIMNMCVHMVYASDGNYEIISGNWDKILNVNALEVAAQRLVSPDRAEEDREIAQRFLTALQNRQHRDRRL